MKRAIRDQQGFTMVELLVVMLIIGVLAEIAIPSFIGQTAKGNDASAKSAVSTAQLAIETYGVDHGTVCGATASDLVAIESSLVNADNLTVDPCPGGKNDTYTVSATSRSTAGTVYSLTVEPAVMRRTCNTPGEGGCSSAGTW